MPGPLSLSLYMSILQVVRRVDPEWAAARLSPAGFRRGAVAEREHAPSDPPAPSLTTLDDSLLLSLSLSLSRSPHVVQPDGSARPTSAPAGCLCRQLRPPSAGDPERPNRLAPGLGPRPHGEERRLPELKGPRCCCCRWQAAERSSGEGWQRAEGRGQSHRSLFWPAPTQQLAREGLTTSPLLARPGSSSTSGLLQVDAVFYSRLTKLLRIVIPSFTSTEAGLLVLHSAFLVFRTLLSLYVAGTPIASDTRASGLG